MRGSASTVGEQSVNRMQSCIESCQRCHATCLQTAMNQCLETGGRHTEPRHFRLMMDCAALCQTAADFMLHKSPNHQKVCALCAEACEACASSCEKVGDMAECVRACRDCAASCRDMAGARA